MPEAMLRVTRTTAARNGHAPQHRWACVTKVGLGREAHEKPNKSGSSAVEKRGLAEKNYVEFRAKRTFVDVHIQSVAEIPNEFGKSHIHDAGPSAEGFAKADAATAFALRGAKRLPITTQ